MDIRKLFFLKQKLEPWGILFHPYSPTPPGPMGQFERHCWAPVLSLYKWGTGAHTERSPMTWHWLTSLPTWLPVLWSCGLFSCHASEHAMPSLSAGPFYVLFFLSEMLPALFHTSPLHSCLSDSCVACGSQQRPVCSTHYPSSAWSMGKCCVSLFWMSEGAPYRSLAPGLPTSSEFRNGNSLSTQIWGGPGQNLVQSVSIPSQRVLIGTHQC